MKKKIYSNYDYLYDLGSDKRPLLSSMTYESNTNAKVNFAYDELGRTTQKSWITTSATPTTLVGFAHTYDLYGNRLTDNHLHNTNDSETLFYDTAQRFTKYERGPIAGTPNFTQTYTLDYIGNWTSFNNNGSIESRSHSVTNELTAQGATILNYDLNGNSLNSKDHQYVWDELNRLIEVKTSSGVTIVAYFYDVHNLRVKKDFGTPEIMYYYCDGRVIEERDENNSLLREYIYGQQYIDEVLSVADQTGSSTTYLYYLTDLRFSVYALIDNLGNIAERYKYNGYGERIVMNNIFTIKSSSSINQEYAYTGRRLDSETNLMYFRARYFNTDQGRFINRDPLGYVDGMGLYNSYFVPRGLDPFGSEEITLALVATGDGEGAFAGYGKKVAKKNAVSFSTGADILNALVKNCEKNCIKHLFIFSHAWAYKSKSGPAHDGGIPVSKSNSGLYGTRLPTDGADARDLSDLESEIKNKKIKFCSDCVITMTGCRVANTGTFAERLATITGCTVRAASGGCDSTKAPKFTSGPGSTDERQDEQKGGDLPWYSIVPPTTPGGTATVTNLGGSLTLW